MPRVGSPAETPRRPPDEMMFFFEGLLPEQLELIHAITIKEKRALAEGRNPESLLRAFNARMDAL